MRVLMLSWEYPPNSVGGLGKHVTELVPALTQQGIEIHLVTPRLNGGEVFSQESENVFIYRVEPPGVDRNDFFSMVWQTNLKLQKTAEQIIEKYHLSNQHFDLIHAHDWLVGFAGGAIKQTFQLPLLATIHATERGRGRGELWGDLPRAINNVEWWLTYEAWRVICCSKYMTEEVQNYFSTPFDKIDTIFNGINTERFDALNRDDLQDFRNRYASPHEKLIFHVGRMVDEKGVRIILDSAHLVLKDCPEAKFVIAGTGPQLMEYKQFANTLGLGEKLYFTGFVPDDIRNKLYKVADVVLCPSLYEPFGIVAIEAMAACSPVVVTDTGGMSEVVSNHENGIKVYPNDPASLAWGILHTFQHPQWTEMRVQNAYRMVKEFYNWERIAGQTIEVYKRIVSERKDSNWGNMKNGAFKAPSVGGYSRLASTKDQPSSKPQHATQPE